MPVRAHLPGYRWLSVFQDAATRTGVYCGVSLSFVVFVWLILSDYVPGLERFALARDFSAATLFCFLALVPVFRFIRLPGNLITASLVSWIVLTIFYRLFCMFSADLRDTLGAFQLFMYGVVVYLIVATLCWIGTIVWRARSRHISHTNHHAS
jgi:hypothetical protein